jgi:hypothetical protein
MRRIASRVVSTLLALALLGQGTPALAKSRPHKARGIGHFVSANDFVSEGIATHLGRFTEMGSAQLSPTDVPAVLRIEGWAIHTAANGDQLYEVFSGRLNLLTGAATATVTYVGGTGRFADARGTAAFSFQLFGDGSFEYAGEGVIDY